MVTSFDRYHIDDAWLSLVERCVRDAEVAGSNPVASTKKKEYSFMGTLSFYYIINSL